MKEKRSLNDIHMGALGNAWNHGSKQRTIFNVNQTKNSYLYCSNLHLIDEQNGLV